MLYAKCVVSGTESFRFDSKLNVCIEIIVFFLLILVEHYFFAAQSILFAKIPL